MIIWGGGRPKRPVEIILNIHITNPIPQIILKNRLIKEKTCVITDINKDNLDKKDIEILEV